MADILTVITRLVAQDQASPTFQKANAQLQQLERGSKGASRGLQDVGSGGRSAVSGLSNLERAVTGAVTAFAGLKTAQFLLEMRAHGEEVRRTTNTYTSLAGGVRDAASALQDLRTRTHGMVGDTQLMAAANDLLRSNLAGSNQEATRLIGLSTDLGATTQQLFSVLANQSYAVLDSFGVASGAVRELKTEFQRAGESSEEAFKHAFLIEAERTVERLGTSIQENLSPTTQLEVKWQNFWDRVSAGAATTLNAAITTAEQLSFILGYSIDQAIADSREARGLNNAPEAFQYELTPFQQAQMQDPGITQQGWEMRTEAADQLRAVIGENIHTFVTGVQDAWDTGTDALHEMGESVSENQKALEENTAALRDMAADITSSIEDMLGWTDPQTRAREGAQRSVVDALTRAGLSQEQIDQVMLGGRQRLDVAAQQGMDVTNPYVIQQAYGIYDPTPGEGTDATFVGQVTSEDMQALGDEFTNFVIEATHALQSGVQDTHNIGFGMTGGTTLVDLYGGEGGPPTESPTVFGGMNYSNMPYDVQQMGEQHAIQVQQGQGMGGVGYMGGVSPFSKSPATFGGMDYSDMPTYGPAEIGAAHAIDVEQQAAGFDVMAQSTTTIAEQSAIAADETHLGAWPKAIDEANTETDIFQKSLASITGKAHTMRLNIELNQATRDALSNWVFQILRNAGFTVGGGGQ